MREDETAYYLKRAAAELKAAELSDCPQAAEAHREMHRRYLHMVEQDSGKPSAGGSPEAEALAG